MNWEQLYEDVVYSITLVITIIIIVLITIWCSTVFGLIFIIKWIQEGDYFSAWMIIGFNLTVLGLVFQKRYRLPRT